MADGLDTSALQAWITEFARTIAEHKEELTELDSAIGDADHGTNMDRGMSAAVAALEAAPPADPAALLKQVGMTLVSKVGRCQRTAVRHLLPADGRRPWARSRPTPRAFAAGAAGRAGRRGRPGQGRARGQDDARRPRPGLRRLDAALAAGQPLGEALQAAAAAAAKGRDATVPLVARKGRASYLGERSAGHQDPGATSTALLLEAAAATLAGS